MKRLFVIACTCLFTIPLFSQNLPATARLTIQKVTISFGAEMDMIRNLDQSYMASTAKDADLSRFNNTQFAPQDLYGGVCENPHIRIMATLGVPGWRNLELNVGATAMFNRFDGVYYYNQNDSWEGDHLSYNSFSDEIALEGSILKRMNFLRFFNIYAGGGTNLGYSFNGDVQINGTATETSDQSLNRQFDEIVEGDYFYDYNYESYKMRDGINQRVFGQVGFGILFFKRLELGMDYRRGIGYRALFGAPVKMTHLESAGINLKWIL